VILSGFLFLVGADGFVGSHMKSKKSRPTTMIANPGDWEIPQKLPRGSTVLFLRAISSPYFVTLNPIQSHSINVTSSSNFIGNCLEFGHRIIYSSSDTIYGERPDLAAKESDVVNPFGLYAEQKNAIEQQFLINPNFLAIRFSIIVGEKSKLRSLLNSDVKAEIPDPVYRNPIGISHVVSLLEKVSSMRNWDSQLEGNVINCGGDEMVSMWELAKIEAKRLGRKSPIKIDRDPIDLISRPESVRLDSSIAGALIGEKLKF
jgi:dTDP-4-dehydrorhamnose reductase